MRIAWFRPSGAAADGDGDHLADVIGALGAAHQIECVDERRAHDFVWRYARGAFDLCVYELDNTARHQYMWPYLLHYPGVLALQSATVHDARRARLVHEGRQADYRSEIAFAGGPSQVRPPWHMARGQWPMLRIPGHGLAAHRRRRRLAGRGCGLRGARGFGARRHHRRDGSVSGRSGTRSACQRIV